MFFKDTSELKDYCSVNISANFNELAVYLKQTDREFILKNIGSAFYTYIQGVYDANAANYAATPTNDKNAIEKLRFASANYALALWLPQGQVQIDSSGVRIANTEYLKTAFQWQIRDLQRSLISLANSCMEDALQFFSDNTVIYTQYASSPEFSLFNNTFIKSAFEFTQYYSNLDNSRLKLMKLKPVMNKAEEFDIKPVLFTTLYNGLKTRILAGTSTAADKNLFPFIKGAVANLTIARAIGDLAINFNENGFIEIDNTGANDYGNSQKTATAIRNLTQSNCSRDGQTYLNKLREYLEANKASYSEYTSDPSYTTYASSSFKNVPTNGYFFGG